MDPNDIRRIYDEIDALSPGRLLARAALLVDIRAADCETRRAARKDGDFVATFRAAYDRDGELDPKALARLRQFCRKEQVRQWQRRQGV